MDKESGQELGDDSSSPFKEVMSEEWEARIPPWGLPDNQDEAYWKEINEQTARGVAVLAASYLEWRIRQSIKTRLIIWDKHAERIFGSDTRGGALGFWEQSEVAYSLGLIGPITLNDLKRIGQIRNKFAHNSIVRSFDHNDVRDNVDNLETPHVRAEKIRAAIAGDPRVGEVREPADRQKRYVYTVHEISTAIWLAGRYYTHPTLALKLPSTYW